MCTPNKKSKLTNLTPCRRLGLTRSPHNFTPPFKDKKVLQESPLASTSNFKTPTKRIGIKSKNKLDFNAEAPPELNTSVDDLKKDIALKKQRLKDLQDNNINAEDLIKQIDIWKNGSRVILEDLLSCTMNDCNDNKNDRIVKILEALNIPCELIGYDPVAEEFID